MSQYKQTVIKNFDAGAFYYDQYADIQKQVAIELCNKIQNTPKTILEIGCGTGFLTNELIDKFPEAQTTATDISSNMIAKCQEKFKQSDKLKFETMDGENVHLDCGFDLIVSSMTFQWFEDLPKAIQNLRNRLNSNGEIYFNLPNAQSFPEWSALLEQNNFHSGLIKAPVQIGVFETKAYQKQYETGLDFLNKIKKIGANTSDVEYKNLNPAELRKLCHQFDKTDRVMSWVIDYCRVSADKDL